MHNKYVIMGVQGCGKGTQAKLLERDFGLVHINVGRIVRWHIESHTKLAARVHRMVTLGQLVPDEIVEEIIRKRLEEHDWNYGFILDGFPRNRSQAEFFLETYDIDAVIHIDVPDEIVVQRILARRLCSECGRDYNLLYYRPAVEDTCDVCQGRLETRPDDTEEAIHARLKDFHFKTQPALELFRRKEVIVQVDGTKTPEEIQSDIRRALNLMP